MRILLERGNANCAPADRGCQTSLPPSAKYKEVCAVKMQFISRDPNTHVADCASQPLFFLGYLGEHKSLLELKDSVSLSFTNYLPSAKVTPLPRPSLLPPYSSRILQGNLTPILTTPGDPNRLWSTGIASLRHFFLFVIYALPCLFTYRISSHSINNCRMRNWWSLHFYRTKM